MLQLTDWVDAYKLINHMNKEAAESQRLHTLKSYISTEVRSTLELPEQQL